MIALAIFRLPGHHAVVKVQEAMATCGRAVIALMHWQPCRWTRKMPTGALEGSPLDAVLKHPIIQSLVYCWVYHEERGIPLLGMMCY